MCGLKRELIITLKQNLILASLLFNSASLASSCETDMPDSYSPETFTREQIKQRYQVEAAEAKARLEETKSRLREAREKAERDHARVLENSAKHLQEIIDLKVQIYISMGVPNPRERAVAEVAQVCMKHKPN